jgi:hypothetical protein
VPVSPSSSSRNGHLLISKDPLACLFREHDLRERPITAYVWGGHLVCATNCGTIRAMTATADDLIRAAADARRVAQNALSLAVREARADGWSWDRISAALGGSPNGETLRRNFGDD